MGKAKVLLAFIFGAAVGGGATYVAVRKKVEEKASEEIQATIEIYEAKKKELQKEINKFTESKSAEKMDNVIDYVTSKVKKYQEPQNDIFEPFEEDEGFDEYDEESYDDPDEYAERLVRNIFDDRHAFSEKDDHIHMVSEEVFWDDDYFDYDQSQLRYTADGYLVNIDTNEAYEDPASVIGSEAMNYIEDEVEWDFIHVKDDKLKMLYEIEFDYVPYEEPRNKTKEKRPDQIE